MEKVGSGSTARLLVLKQTQGAGVPPKATVQRSPGSTRQPSASSFWVSDKLLLPFTAERPPAGSGHPATDLRCPFLIGGTDELEAPILTLTGKDELYLFYNK